MLIIIYIFLIIFLFLAVCLVFLMLLYFIYSVVIFFFTGVPFMPTPKKCFRILFKELIINPDDVVYDLGCGAGDFLIAARKEFGCGPKLIGYEFSPALVWLARFRSYIKKTDINFIMGDYLKANISDANVIYLFLVPPVLPKIWQKIKKETKTVTVVVSLSSQIAGVEYYKKIKTNPNKKTSSYFYFYKI